MGPELVWQLQHVWPKGTPDLTTVDISSLPDTEAERIVEQVEDVKREFERFFADDVVPHISLSPTAFGAVETVRLFTSGHSMNTDYLLLLSGIWMATGEWSTRSRKARPLPRRRRSGGSPSWPPTT